MLCSLFENSGACRVHLFHGSIAAGELTKLKSFVEKYKSDITFYHVEPETLRDLRVDKWVSVATYYRLVAPHLLPISISKILYLDSDIIVRGPLDELWNTDLIDYALAAVANSDDNARKALGLSEGSKYFNAGVLLINLEFWRRTNVPERAILFSRKNPDKVQYWDQDALNATLIGQWIELPQNWNWQHWQRRIPDTQLKPVIVHFVAKDKPWQWANEHPLKREYHRYRSKTPWSRYIPEGRPPLLQRLCRRLYRLLKPVARQALPNGIRQRLRPCLNPLHAWYIDDLPVSTRLGETATKVDL
jgi:lipopolysaccharide biosynthesis glycosyltransferase